MRPMDPKFAGCHEKVDEGWCAAMVTVTDSAAGEAGEGNLALVAVAECSVAAPIGGVCIAAPSWQRSKLRGEVLAVERPGWPAWTRCR